MIYDVNGSAVNNGYSVNGEIVNALYDVEGNLLDDDPIVTPMNWDMTFDYKAQVLSALDYIRQYEASHENSYAFCQFNDVHNAVTGYEPNFIDYNKGYKYLSAMLFMGDIVDGYSEENALLGQDFVMSASASHRLMSTGNHEYYGATSGTTTGACEGDYETYLDDNVVRMYPNDNAVIYYYDDADANVRYIVLNPNYISKTPNTRTYDDAQVKWCANAILQAGGKDIILGNHYQIPPFTLLESGEEVTSTATGTITKVIDLISAFKNRTIYTIDGTTYDYSNSTGDFVLFTSGHYHGLGHSNSLGFNMFTCPNLGNKVWGGGHHGFVFFLIDKTLKSIKVIQCSSELTDYIDFDFTY